MKCDKCINASYNKQGLYCDLLGKPIRNDIEYLEARNKCRRGFCE